MAKQPPRETIGKTICMNRFCSEVATVKRDTAGYLYQVCPACRTGNNHTDKYQAALIAGMAAYSAPPPEDTTGGADAPIDQPPAKTGGLLGGLSIFS